MGLDRLRYSARTHVGRVRAINEDCILSLPDEGIWLVADGMGGHEGGDYASQTVVDTVATIPHGLDPAQRMRFVRQAIHRAHDHLREKSAAEGNRTMGATVVALVLTASNFVAFWAGDSRLYRFRDDDIQLLSVDHSIVAPLVETGQITWDEADLMPESNVVTQAVGAVEDLDLSKIRGEVRPGDRYLLCSDGLSKYYSLGALAMTLRAEPLETVVEALLEGALESGGDDNISIIVVDVA